jgi:heptosyltransferase-2
MHLSDEYLRLGDLIDLAPPPDPLPLLLPNEADLARARARLEGLAVGEHRFAVLGPGAAYGPAKRWPLDRYVALGRGLRERGLAPLVCGASEDRHIAAPLASRIGPGAHALAGETSLGEQLALCAMASVTVCNDSGLAHLAAATGAPTVVIFGSTSSSWTAPRGPRVVVVQRSPVCSPCFRRTCRIGYRCLEAVTTRRVLDACEEAAA